MLEAPDTVCDGEWGRNLYARRGRWTLYAVIPLADPLVQNNVIIVQALDADYCVSRRVLRSVRSIVDGKVAAERSFAKEGCQVVGPFRLLLSWHCRYCRQDGDKPSP